MKLKFSKELQKSFDEAQQALNQCEQTRGLIASDTRRLEVIASELREGFQRLATAEAESVLATNEATVNLASPALQRQQALRAEAEILEARIAGLKTKLLASEDGLLSRQEALIATRAAFAKEKVSEFRQ